MPPVACAFALLPQIRLPVMSLASPPAEEIGVWCGSYQSSLPPRFPQPSATLPSTQT